ncbi:MAG TPA: IS21 family transposase [Candidatus Limnocylindrales bacterium]|nr:IS21 family transposase [Candidatus Limnocylindrales bacterium]
MMSRVELFAAIRRDRRDDPTVSARTLAKRYRVARRTVAAALVAAVPKSRKALPPRASVLDVVAYLIDEMLRVDLTAPRKQRHTVRRIVQRLVTEHGFTAAYTTVRDYVRRRRPQIGAEARDQKSVLDGMVPQEHEPAAEAEVDFCEACAVIAGVLTEFQLFSFRLSCSGKAVHRAYATASQEAFLEGHVEALRILGGVPWRHVRYDNLKPAVNEVCFGRTRVESQRWTAFRSHYGFDAFYCLPGKEGAHEKGGVENEGGRFRRAHLVPVPRAESLDELNDLLAAIDKTEDERVPDNTTVAVRVAFAAEAPLLRPLPEDDFDCGLTLTPTVNSSARITVRQCYYSVPARFIGRKVRVSLRANHLIVFDGRREVARHPRLTQRYSYRDELDHYLEILLAKPGALAGSSALAIARVEGTFTPTHQAFWDAAMAAHGRAEGTRALIQVLLLHRRRPAAAVLAGITAALGAGSTSPELVAVEARKAAGGLGSPDLVDLSDLDLPIPRTDRPADAMPPLRPRPAPSVAQYDQLLTHRGAHERSAED